MELAAEYRDSAAAADFVGDARRRHRRSLRRRSRTSRPIELAARRYILSVAVLDVRRRGAQRSPTIPRSRAALSVARPASPPRRALASPPDATLPLSTCADVGRVRHAADVDLDVQPRAAQRRPRAARPRRRRRSPPSDCRASAITTACSSAAGDRRASRRAARRSRARSACLDRRLAGGLLVVGRLRLLVGRR